MLYEWLPFSCREPLFIFLFSIIFLHALLHRIPTSLSKNLHFRRPKVVCVLPFRIRGSFPLSPFTFVLKVCITGMEHLSKPGSFARYNAFHGGPTNRCIRNSHKLQFDFIIITNQHLPPIDLDNSIDKHVSY